MWSLVDFFYGVVISGGSGGFGCVSGFRCGVIFFDVEVELDEFVDVFSEVSGFINGEVRDKERGFE